MGLSRQEHWSGLPCPSPGDRPDPGIKPGSLMSPALAVTFFTTRATCEAFLQGGCAEKASPPGSALSHALTHLPPHRKTRKLFQPLLSRGRTNPGWTKGVISRIPGCSNCRLQAEGASFIAHPAGAGRRRRRRWNGTQLLPVLPFLQEHSRSNLPSHIRSHL